MENFIYIFQWWIVFFIIGIIFLPLTTILFNKFSDFGYSFSKVIGIAFITYIIFTLGTLKILPFGYFSTLLILWVVVFVNFGIFHKKNLWMKLKTGWKIFLLEEILFLIGIITWSYIRSFDPNINGLEKFMDFGFLNSILRSSYFPASDMWFPPLSINYYYFRHLSTAVLTKLSILPSYITYNLMLATLFAFTFTLSFSLVFNIINTFLKSTRRAILGGILGALLVTVSGNLHTIYSLFTAYDVENPVPFWSLIFSPATFPNSYWYPNATRFIPFTIHEFPIYSFVVSDLHGHVIDLMFVLLSIAVIYILFLNKHINNLFLIFVGFLISIMYMTNAWDGIIYLFLASIVIGIKNVNILKLIKDKKQKNILSFKIERIHISNKINYFADTIKKVFIIILSFIFFSLPFNLNFKPFASGIGIVCPPEFLISIERLGPFLFENNCQSTPWWQFLVLYGFFYFFVFTFLFLLYKNRQNLIIKQDIFILILIFVSTILIIIPEFIYVKDIYPAHFRANTMFKLVYQAFILLSISSIYIIVRIMNTRRNILFYIFTLILLIFVFSYPYFAIKSYYSDLNKHQGLDGIKYLETRYPDDYHAITWINKNITGQAIIAEAVGESYTDYGRISANTGLPTVLGWPVHEWLWRGTYDIPAPRIDDVKMIYESNDLLLTKSLLEKYEVEYVYIGQLEKEKYPLINELKFNNLGTVVFESNTTRIYNIR